MTAAAAIADVVVMAAAVSDYRAAQVSELKLSKEDAAGPGLTLQLVRTPDIVAGLAERRPPEQTVVAFVAETEDDPDALRDPALPHAARKGGDLLVAHLVGWTGGFRPRGNTVAIDREETGEGAGGGRAVHKGERA